MDDRDLELVRAAFERLLDKVSASGCDDQTAQIIYFAQVDVLAILNGEWDDEPAERDEPTDEFMYDRAMSIGRLPF